MKIIPHTDAYENEISYRLPWTYLHGQLEAAVGYDIFGFQDFIGEVGADDRAVPHSISAGKHPCSFEGKECTLYYWFTGTDIRRSYAGLVVYNDDKDAIQYAEKCFTSKTDMI